MAHRFRKGDIVSITGKIRHDHSPGEGFVMIDLDGYYQHISVAQETVTLIAPRIDPGEIVRWTNGKQGKVLASEGEKLWVKIDAPDDLDDRSYVTWPVKEVVITSPDLGAIEAPPMAPDIVETIDGPADVEEAPTDG